MTLLHWASIVAAVWIGIDVLIVAVLATATRGRR